MQGIFVRVCSWFTLIIFSLMSIVGLIMILVEKINIAAIITFIMCLLVSVTGWYARRYGLSGFKTNKLSKLSAILSLIFGIGFIILIPILFANLFGFENTYLAIRNLLILFLPAVIASIAILSSKSGETKEQIA